MQKLSGAENAVLGAVAGGIEICIDQPMIYWKNATQQNMPFTMKPEILYRGLGASVANMATLTGIQFISTGYVKKLITGGVERNISTKEKIGAATIGGMLSGLAAGPMELIMIQQQRFGGTFLGTPRGIIAANGPMGMTRGVMTSVAREGAFSAGMLGLAPCASEWLETSCGLNHINASIGGSFLGTIAVMTTQPFDTVKTCMQGDIHQKTYTSALKTMNAIYKEKGVRRLYNGWFWRGARMVCTMFWINLISDGLAPVLFPHHFDTPSPFSFNHNFV